MPDDTPPHDTGTLDFYAREAVAYASRSRGSPSERIGRFVDHLPAGAAILELGCGGGIDTTRLATLGFKVTPTDGCAEMAAEAERRTGIPVRVMRFDELDAEDAFMGVWANACLLHVPSKALAGVIRRIHRSMTSGGAFYASFKAGTRPGRDGLGRYYSYPSQAQLRNVMAEAGEWRDVGIGTTPGHGCDGQAAEWLHMLATKA